MQVTNEQFKTEPDEIQAEYVSKPWRRFKRAVDAMNEADEAEDYQAVGMRCREALIALVREYQDADWVRIPEKRPKGSSVKEWMSIYAASLTVDRPRAYIRALADKTWDLTNWLQHYSGATTWDAQLVLDATANLLNTFSLLQVRYEEGSAERCPECDSYQLMEDSDAELVMVDGRIGGFLWNVCLSCGWQSEKEFDHWPLERLKRAADYIEGKWSPPMRSMEELEVQSDD
jgi:hypothetical protein